MAGSPGMIRATYRIQPAESMLLCMSLKGGRRRRRMTVGKAQGGRIPLLCGWGRDRGPRRRPSGEDVGNGDRAERLAADRDRDQQAGLEILTRPVTGWTRVGIDLDAPLGQVDNPIDRDPAVGVGGPFLAPVAIVGALGDL